MNPDKKEKPFKTALGSNMPVYPFSSAFIKVPKGLAGELKQSRLVGVGEGLEASMVLEDLDDVLVHPAAFHQVLDGHEFALDALFQDEIGRGVTQARKPDEGRAEHLLPLVFLQQKLAAVGFVKVHGKDLENPGIDLLPHFQDPGLVQFLDRNNIN